MTRSTLTLATLSLLAACSGGGNSAAPLPPPTAFSLSGVATEVAQDRVTLSWTSSHEATGVVHWGLPGDLSNDVPFLTAATEHELLLTGLEPDTEYAFEIVAYRDNGTTTSSDEVPFQTLSPLAFAPDDFDAANLDVTRWSLVDPTGLGALRMVGTGTTDAHLELEVPAGVESMPWTTGNSALRVMQTVPAGDWSLQIKFDGALDTNGTGHGLLIEVDEDTFLRFDFAFNGNKAQVFAGHLDGGTALETFSEIIQTGAWSDGTPLWMRVSRLGQMYTQEWSEDGFSWHPGGQFTMAEEPLLLGLQAITAGTGHTGHLVRVDYLMDAAESVAGEDAAPRLDQEVPLLYRAEAAVIGDDQVRLRWWTDEPASATVQHGQDTSYADGSLEVAPGLYAQELVVAGLAADTTHHFQITARDSGGRSVVSNDLEATTNPPGVSGIPELTLWYGDAQPDGSWTVAFGQLGNPQHQVNILGNVSDDDEDRLVDTVSLYYKLNDASWNLLALGDDRTISYDPWRLANEGDFNLEIGLWELTQAPLVDGVHRNEVIFEALDDDGHATFVTVYVDYTPGVTWTPTTSIDWSTVEQVTDVAQVVDGNWYVEDHPGLGHGLRQRPDSLGYDRLVAIGEGEGLDAWENYEVTVDATVLAFDELGWTEGTQSYAIGLALRWSGHNPGWGPSQPNHDIYPFGGIFVSRWFETFERWELWINKDSTILPFDAPIDVGTTYVFKARCETQVGGGTRYRIKRWEAGTTEPAAWDFDYTTPADQDHPEGSLLLIAHHVDVLYGNVTVTEL